MPLKNPLFSKIVVYQQVYILDHFIVRIYMVYKYISKRKEKTCTIYRQIFSQ